jgi:type IV secretory pathway TraG/TraD family ATPase VirD4
MFENSGPYRRAKRALLVSTALPLCLIGTIVALPKNPDYAAADRLVLTLVLFVTVLVGLAGFRLSRRRCRELAMLHRYGGASSQVRDTISYLKQERRLAASGQFAFLVSAILASGLYVTAHWPRAEVLAPCRTAFGVLAIALLASVPICALRNRTHYVNAVFLRLYLRQQIDHLGFQKPKRRRRKKQQINPNGVVTVTGPGRFAINGFEWSFQDFTANAVVMGQTGSGKTVTVLNSILEGLLASHADTEYKIGGLLLDPKGDYYDKIQALCVRYSYEDRLLILDPSAWANAAGTPRSIAWNPLDSGDDALEVATRLIAALRLVGLEQGHEGSYFLDSARSLLRHSVTLVRASAISPAPSLVDVYRLTQESDDRTPFYHQLITAISARHPGPVPIEVTDAIAYFEQGFAKIADREKSALRGTMTQLLDEFLLPPFRDIFTQPSTVSIGDMIDQGKILYVHMPSADRERMSRLVNTLLKLEYQRNILTRVGKTQPTFFLCDEYQAFYTSGDGRSDSDFFERSRQSNHCNIVATQNLPAFLKRSRNPNDIKNFLGNAAIKIFLRQSEEETNRWASALFGNRSEIVITTSEQAAIDGGWSRRRHTSYGKATRSLPRMPPEAFARLAIPVRGSQLQAAESIVHLGSRGETQHHELAWPVNPLR